MRGWILPAALLAAAMAFSNAARAQEAGSTAPAEPTAAPVVVAQPQPAPEPEGRPGLGLIIAGWTVFGVLYVPNLIWGIASAVYYAPSAIFIIPGFGPIITGAMALATGGLMEEAKAGQEVSGFVKGMGVFFLIWGLLELGSIAMAITGHVIRAGSRADVDARLDGPAWMKKKAGFRVTPIAGRECVGLGVAGWF